jgi:hypothetical protein
MLSTEQRSFSYEASFSTDGLWLQITGIANGIVSLNLINATDTVYEVWSKTDLSETNWNIETEVFPTNQAVMPFTIAEKGRPNLMVWARDWTGITSHGNETPEWWFYKYFGMVNLSDTNLDVNGNTLLYDYENGIDPTIITRLWLHIHGITNGTVSLTLNNATDMVYEVWSATSLINPVSWNIEQAVWPVTNQTSTPFAVQVQDRTNSLFFWARDWTGITSNGNETPEWWFYEYFGTVDLSDTNLDTQGNTLLWDYQNGFEPNVIYFSLSVADQYFNTGSATVQVGVSAGVPSYMAALVDDTNLADANWMPYNSNLVVNLGSVEGWHTVWVGLRGLPPNAQQTWNPIPLELILTPPVLVITNPSTSTVMQPVIEVQGFCSKPLASLTFDLSNAVGVFTNQQAFVLSQYSDPNTQHFTTNTFQAFDVPLTNGDNVVTFYATDLAGNTTTTNITYTLDYSGKTNPPVIQLYWPQNGDQISGTTFTLRGSLDDFTASLTALIVDSSGDTNTVQGLVERNGLYWVENVPFLEGTNYVTLTAMDAVGNISSTNLTISVSAGLTIDDFSSELGGTPRTIIPIVTGTVALTNYTLWVNGIQATQNGDGTWDAYSVPVGPGGTAVVEARAIPNSDNSGNGTGTTPPSDGTPGNPTGADSMAAQTQIDQPTVWYMEEYQYSGSSTDTETENCGFTSTDVFIGQFDSAYMNGGTANSYIADSGSGFGDSWSGWENQAFSWPCDQCPVTDVYTDSYGDSSTSTVDVPYALTYSGSPDPMLTAEWTSDVRYSGAYPLEGNDGCSSVAWDTHDTESICTQMTLQTGGKGTVTRQNLFEIDVSAVNFTSTSWSFSEETYVWNTEGVPPGAITVAGKTANTNGQIFTVLPDNTTMDITPQAPPQRYTYSVGAIKYPASFTVYVTQPYPGFTYPGYPIAAPPPGFPIWAPGINAGHAWWQFNCGAPTAAMNQFTSTNNSQWLNKQLGFGPASSVLWESRYTIGTAPGEFPFPYGNPPTTNATYTIGFYNLIGGLVATEDINTASEAWQFPGNTCITAICNVGAGAGIALPNDTYPEDFGVHLPPGN